MTQTSKSIEDALKAAKKASCGALIPFVVAGDPDAVTTVEIIRTLGRAGADVIELGIPFSDPVADGETIQQASERALRCGTNIGTVIGIVRRVRELGCTTPIVLFSYFNPILRYGLERFAEDAAEAGANGVLVTDLPVDECGPFLARLRLADLSLIQLVSPTSSGDRLRKIADAAGGFIYAVSRTGVTGERSELSREAETLVRKVREFSNLPVAVGFGISSKAHVEEVWNYADAAVVGSALVKIIEAASRSDGIPKIVEKYISELLGARSAVDIYKQGIKSIC